MAILQIRQQEMYVGIAMVEGNIMTVTNKRQYVTEYWKTDHLRTFGQLLFIGPANSHTHTLPVHCCITGLS